MPRADNSKTKEKIIRLAELKKAKLDASCKAKMEKIDLAAAKKIEKIKFPNKKTGRQDQKAEQKSKPKKKSEQKKKKKEQEEKKSEPNKHGPRSPYWNEDLYKLLGISPSATLAQIKSAYRKMMLKNHPDKGGTTAFAQKLVFASETLTDPDRRKAYDARRAK